MPEMNNMTEGPETSEKTERSSKKDRRPVSRNGRPSGGRRPLPNRNPKLPPGNETNLNHIFRTLLLWAVMFAGVAGLFFLFNRGGEPAEVEVSNTRYQQLLADGKFASGKIEQYGLNQYRFHGVFKQTEYIENPVADKKPIPTMHIVTNLIPETLND